MRSYKAARRAAKGSGVPFDLTWYDDEDAEHVDTFKARGQVSSATIMDLGEYDEDDVPAPLVKKALRQVIGDAEEFDRLWAVADHIDVMTLAQIMQDLVEATTGRPTERPSDSPTSSRSAGESSKVVSLPGGFSIQAQPIESSSSAAASS